MNTEQKRSLIGFVYLLLRVLSAIVRKRVERRMNRKDEGQEKPENQEKEEKPD